MYGWLKALSVSQSPKVWIDLRNLELRTDKRPGIWLFYRMFLADTLADKIKMHGFLVFPAVLGLLAATGCGTTGSDSESGPEHTVAYYIKIESSLPEITIETNHVVAGKTPLTLKVFGDPPGTFHNFGSPDYSLRALPLSTNEFPQARIFRTGKRSTPGERIPGLVFFDLSQPAGGVLIDSIPDR